MAVSLNLGIVALAQRIGQEIKAGSVRCATTANITLSGAQTIDGVTPATNDLVLVKDQTAASGNGVYSVSTAGAWTRAVGWDTAANVARRGEVWVREGTLWGGTEWCTGFKGTATLGTTSMPWLKLGPLAMAKFKTPQRPTVADFAIPTGADTKIRWTATDYADPLGVITNPNSALNGNGRIFLARPGWYRISANITFASSATGDRNLAIYNSGGIIWGYDSDGGHAGQGTSLRAICLLQILPADITAATNWFDTQCNQSSGAALALFGTSAGFHGLMVEELNSAP